MALGSEVVDLGGLHLVDDLHEAGAVTVRSPEVQPLSGSRTENTHRERRERTVHSKPEA